LTVPPSHIRLRGLLRLRDHAVTRLLTRLREERVTETTGNTALMCEMPAAHLFLGAARCSKCCGEDLNRRPLDDNLVGRSARAAIVVGWGTDP
jgi:hypothetical protein